MTTTKTRFIDNIMPTTRMTLHKGRKIELLDFECRTLKEEGEHHVEYYARYGIHTITAPTITGFKDKLKEILEGEIANGKI